MVLTVTMNPALDKLYAVEQFSAGEVNRVQKVCVTAGGKGLNVARVAHTLGEQVTATGIVGGDSGRLLCSLLEDGIGAAFVQTPGQTRSCVNIRETSTGRHTELLEPGPVVSSECLETFCAQFSQLLPRCDVVALSGSLPQGCPEDFYARLIVQARAAGKAVLLDTSGGALRAAVSAGPTVLKPNADELEQLTGCAAKTTQEAVETARRLQKNGVPYVLVSLGAQGAVLACAQGVLRAQTPQVPVQNTVGCGDSMLAGFAVGLARGEAADVCLRMGIACGAANAMTQNTGSISRQDYERILASVVIQ